MFSPNFGYIIEVRKDAQKRHHKNWDKLLGSTTTFAQFQGKNIHVVSNYIQDAIEIEGETFLLVLTSMFDYWEDTNAKIKGSFGSSYEGWINSFKDLCTSIDIVSSDDKRTESITEENNKPKPGEIIVYFDDLKEKDEKDNPINKKEIHDAWLRCKNVAEPTKSGTDFEKIAITFSNGDVREYSYYNLIPSKYTKIDIRYKIKYQTDSINYPQHRLEEHIRYNFNKENRINKPLYPETLFCVPEFEGIESIVIKHKLSTETDSDFKAGTRSIKLGNKYIISDKITEEK